MILSTNGQERKLLIKPSYQAICRYLRAVKMHELNVESALAVIEKNRPWRDENRELHDLEGENNRVEPQIAYGLAHSFETGYQKGENLRIDKQIEDSINLHRATQEHHQAEMHFNEASSFHKFETVVDGLCAIIESGTKYREIIRPYNSPKQGAEDLRGALAIFNGNSLDRRAFAPEVVKLLEERGYRQPYLLAITHHLSEPRNTFGIPDNKYERINEKIRRAQQLFSGIL